MLSNNSIDTHTQADWRITLNDDTAGRYNFPGAKTGLYPFQPYPIDPRIPGGPVLPSTPPTPPTIDEIKNKFFAGDVDGAIEDLKTLGVNIDERNRKVNPYTGAITIEFEYDGKKYKWTGFDPSLKDDNDGGDSGGGNPIFDREPLPYAVDPLVLNRDIVKIDPGFIVSGGDEPLDNIFEVMDLNDISGYKNNKKVIASGKSNKRSSILKEIKQKAKDSVAQYKDTFKTYACGLLGNDFASQYSELFDGLLDEYVNQYAYTTEYKGDKFFAYYNTKDFIDGFLTKLDEAIKAKKK